MISLPTRVLVDITEKEILDNWGRLWGESYSTTLTVIICGLFDNPQRVEIQKFTFEGKESYNLY